MNNTYILFYSSDNLNQFNTKYYTFSFFKIPIIFLYIHNLWAFSALVLFKITVSQRDNNSVYKESLSKHYLQCLYLYI